MEAKDLRIGNIIECDNIEYNVWDISGGYVGLDSAVKDHHTTKCLDKINPIPLTDKHLDRLGFKSNGDEDDEEWYCISQPHFALFLGLDGTWKMIFDTYFIDIEIKYVNQLQNIFYFLENEELVLNTQAGRV